MEKVDIQLDLDQDLLFDLMMMAHEQDVTLNQLINRLVREHLDRLTNQ